MKRKINALLISKITLTGLLVVLSFSCKKDTEIEGNLGKGSLLEDEIGLFGKQAEAYAVGGTIGCFIRYADSKGKDSYAAATAYDQCIEGELEGEPVLGFMRPRRKRLSPAAEDLTDKLTTDLYLMHLYFATFGIDAPFGEIDNSPDNPQILKIQTILVTYNQIITEIFTNNNREIPSDRLERRNIIINYLELNYNYLGPNLYSPLVPQADCSMFLSYVDLVYGKNFYMPMDWENILYPRIKNAPLANLYGIRHDPKTTVLIGGWIGD